MRPKAREALREAHARRIGSEMVAELPWPGYAFLLTAARLSPTTKSAFCPLGLCPQGAVL